MRLAVGFDRHGIQQPHRNQILKKPGAIRAIGCDANAAITPSGMKPARKLILGEPKEQTTDQYALIEIRLEQGLNIHDRVRGLDGNSPQLTNYLDGRVVSPIHLQIPQAAENLLERLDDDLHY